MIFLYQSTTFPSNFFSTLEILFFVENEVPPTEMRPVKTSWSKHIYFEKRFPRGYPRRGSNRRRGGVERRRRFVSMYPWRVRCEKKLVYMYRRDGGGAPLACLRYESRGSLSDVLCRAIWIVLYTRDVPPSGEKRAENFSGPLVGCFNIAGSSVYSSFRLLLVRVVTSYSSKMYAVLQLRRQ